MSGRPRRDRGQLEREVLAVLATSDTAMTPAEVLAELEDGLAYTTVMTTLARMAGRGVLDRERAGRAYAYRPLRDPETLTARRMHRLLEQDTNRAGVLARFVEELKAEDEGVLAAILDETAEDSPE
jgi:predicted transcriptional regulator